MRILACQECRRQWDVSRYRVGQKLRCVCNHVMEVPRPVSYAPEVHHCESCGAARERKAGPCTYCGATPSEDARRLSLVCPFCLHRTPDKSKFCSCCGEAIQAAKLDTKTGNLDCPRCRETKLLNRKVGAFTVDECPGCSGMWVEAATFGRLVKEQAAREESNVSALGRRGPRKSTLEEKVAYVKCPECQRLMNRFNFARVSGVIVDECREHGVWLDCDELGKIAAYVSTGGLAHTRKIEARERRVGPTRRSTPFPAMNQFPRIRTSHITSDTPLDAVLELVGKLF